MAERRDQLPSDVDEEEEMCAFCSTGPECEPLPLQAETEHHDGAAAVVQCEKVWKGRETLKVHFMNPKVLESWGIGVTPEQILDWANEAWWKGEDSNVPKFKPCEVLNKVDIRVKFAGTKSEGCWWASMPIGAEARSRLWC
ncbi:uncharacterized protein LOC135332901 [Halichondria panicea]|uniref:uncharacterized protein LOC135332901 n=1 Tax=Halichondria panicea TaxID=6063 RepID=UPI00312BAA0A